MRKFAVIGHPISHTMSPFIHKELFSARNEQILYDVLDIPPKELCEKLSLLKQYDGLSVTIPLKTSIIPFLDNIDENAKICGAANTVNGKDFKGYTTDAQGFLNALESKGQALKGKILCLGCGGVSRTICFEAAKNGCEITVAVRKQSLEKAQGLVDDLKNYDKNLKVYLIDTNEITGDFDLFFNGTPVGMYPNTHEMPVKEEVLDHVKVLFDAVYNPQKTMLITEASKRGITVIDGLSMLVWQAAAQQEIWDNIKIEPQTAEKTIQKASEEIKRIFYGQNNIFLCGFMGCGKTTFGRALAEHLSFDFADTDSLIEQSCGMSIKDIFEKKGEHYFRDIEHNLCKKLAKRKNTIIATGGGVFTFKRNVFALKYFGKTVFIDTPFDVIEKRLNADTTRPLFKSSTGAQKLFDKRRDMYIQNADIVIDGVKDTNAMIENVCSNLKG